MNFFSDGIAGPGVKDPNFRLRFFVIIFMGAMACGVVLYWRGQLLLSTEYVDVPMSKHLQKRYQLDNLDQ